MDIVLVILLICALISAIAFNQGVPSTPEWNPFEIFFQGYLGWDIYKTTVFCAGSLIVAWLPIIVIGRLTGWSKGLWFDPTHTSYENQDYNSLTYEQRVELGQAQSESVKGSLLRPMMAVVLITFVIALCKMGA